MATFESLAAAYGAAMNSPLFDRITGTMNARLVLPDDRTGPERARAALHKGGPAVGPWGAAFSMEVVLSICGAAAPAEGMAVLLGGFRGIEDDELGNHGRARSIIREHADAKWRERRAGHLGARTAFHSSELKIVAQGGQRFGTVVDKVFDVAGTIDYGVCIVDDPLLWTIKCIAEAEMSTFRADNPEAVRDLRKLFTTTAAFRLYVCRASCRGGSDAGLRAAITRVIHAEVASPLVAIDDEVAVLMLVADGGAGERSPWGGLYRHAENGAALQWRELNPPR